VIRCLAFAPDGKTLATGGGFDDVPGEVKLWDLATGSEGRSFQGKQNGVYALAFAPDGQTLATASFDQMVRLWDVATGRELSSLPFSLPASLGITLAPDGRTLALARANGDTKSVRLWPVAPEGAEALSGGAGPFAFSANGQHLVLW